MATILTANDKPVEGSLVKLDSWQASMKAAIRSSTELLRYVQIDESAGSSEPEADFPVFVPLEYANRMKFGDADDPLLRQVLAVPDELLPGGTTDPVGDTLCVRTGGMLQKYARRVLLISSGTCAVHCRYCFRRHFAYESNAPGKSAWESWTDEIRSDSRIDEVILSGGDPLTLVDESLAELIGRLDSIDHVRRIRIHTRFPVVIPQRVDAALLEWAGKCDAALYFVLHFNHANELDTATVEAMRRLRSSGATLLNQAVLLHGVNDTLEQQKELCVRLVDQQILPYYLHQLDPVQGAMHFDVPDERAKRIHRGLQEQLPGYAVPRLVREIPGELSKSPIQS